MLNQGSSDAGAKAGWRARREPQPLIVGLPAYVQLSENEACQVLAARTLPALGPVVVQAEGLDLAAESIAMNSQGMGGLRLIAVVLFENGLDETLLKLLDGIGVEDFILDHLANECLKQVFHGSAPTN
jgi:hypothetical protein